jgi:UDP-N-acetylmuramate dehydrogenase
MKTTPSGISIQQDVMIKHLNTFGIEAKADYFAVIKDTQELIELLSIQNIHKIPKLILGEGSNILFTKNYAGLVIKNAIKGIQQLEEDKDHYWIQAGAGENWHEFVMHCIQRGYGGLENFSLIPGSVGAAPIQNIGAYGVELSENLFQLEALNLQDGSVRTFTNTECQFGYRDSVFKKLYKDQYAILNVVFRLNKNPKLHIDYGNLKETLQSMNVGQLNIKAISDAVIHIRQNKLPDPKKLGNAGSFFKNPIIPYTQFIELQNKYPQIPYYLTEKKDSIKLSGAWLIEQCGWKGKRFDDVGVYEKQALILVNYGNGSGVEILELANKIQSSVKNKFGIFLEPEVNLI